VTEHADILAEFEASYMISYEKAEQLLSQFMTDTGIRDYCTLVCEGDCCNGSFKCNDNCFTGKRKITCSIYLCQKLEHYLFPDGETLHLFITLWRKIRETVQAIGSAEVKKRTGFSYFNPYFSPNTEYLRNKAKFNGVWIKNVLLTLRENIALSPTEVRQLKWWEDYD
jgi:hypothetical protein